MTGSCKGALARLAAIYACAAALCLAFAGQAHAEGALSPGQATGGGMAPQAAEYSVWVAGTKVTSANARDVLGDGTVRYDARTNTLTLKNARIGNAMVWTYDGNDRADGIISATGGKFTVRLVGKNTVSIPSYAGLWRSYGISSMASAADMTYAPLTFKGSGKLTVKASDARTYSYGVIGTTVTVKGKAKLTATGASAWSTEYPEYGGCGICAQKKTVIKGKAKVVASGGTAAFDNKKVKFGKGYTPKVKAGSSAKSISVNKKKPSKKVYTNYKYVKITKAKSSAGSSSSAKPGKVKVTSVEPGSGLFWIYWKTVKGASGYQIQVSERSGFAAGETYTHTVEGATSQSSGYTYIYGLENGTPYFTRMRAFAVKDGKTRYGKWSLTWSVVPTAGDGMA